MEKMTYSFRTS